MDKLIFTRLAQIYHCEMEKNWLDFADLDLIFKVTEGHWVLEKMACQHNIFWTEWWMDLKQTCTDISLWNEKELIRFWWPWPYFQGHRRSEMLKNGLSEPYLLNGWMDFNQTCINISLGDGKETDKILVTLTSFSRSQEVVACWNMACLHDNS